MSAHVDRSSRTCRSALFYHVGYDLETPFNVCGGMQDNYDWCGPSASRFTRGITNGRLVPGAGRRRLRRDHRSARLAHRLHRVAGRQHHAARTRSPAKSKSIRPTAAERRSTPSAGEPAYRFHWDTPMMFSPHDPGTLLVGGQQRVQVHRSRRLVDGDQPGPDDQRQPQRRRDDGREGQRHPHLARRRHRGVADDRRARRIAEAGRASTTPARTTACVSVSKDARQDVDEHHRQAPGLPEGRVRLGGRAVALRRGHGVRHRRRAPPERLRDATSG